MKATNWILTSCLVALTLVSCEKDESALNQSTKMKSVTVSLENVVSGTRGVATDKINKDDAVVVNDFKIFLTDAQGKEYTAQTSNGAAAAKSYWSASDLATDGIPVEADFHYVDPNCTTVVAVANIGSDMTFAEYTALAALDIDEQQDATNLALFDSKPLTESGEHTDVNTTDGTTYLSKVYEATLVLTPRIARFEVDGFQVKFDATDPKYNSVEVKDIAFQNYYPASDLKTGEESGALVNHIADLANQSEVYNWFNGLSTTNWYCDSFADGAVVMTPADDLTDTPDPLAYHMFAGDAVPVMVIRLLADDLPAYIYTKRFLDSNGDEITEFKEGYIYRMSAAGEVSGDGSIVIPEDDIDPMDRCLDITVDVAKWAVELITPEF
ncbi:MAG: hypothetical protein IKA60_04600 [Rikenellaceae bacterium]|nr:hypothetical protein [Rikenellaceae bacterium]